MRLKKIEIVGFKSFADKTVLEFNAGITGIVGPNGCGKSNIADAFRWVLGEQSAKSLRGGKMYDIIFAGSTNRKPLPFAEVSITLTDIQGALPIEYEEVTVTRCLYRDGDSDYLINRQPVRLKDIHHLFLDSGMGKQAFSIFEQGKIDQIIQLNPKERRCIFEEAAGILRFLQRKREALRKLEQMDLNMSRVHDIHQEVEKNLALLKMQAEKALLYKDNKHKLESLEKGLSVAKWDALEKKCLPLIQKDKEQKLVLDRENEQGRLLHDKLQEAKRALEVSEKVLRVHSEEVYQIRSSKELKIQERHLKQEKHKELKAKEKTYLRDLEDSKIGYKNRQKEIAECQRKQSAMEKELNALQSALSSDRSKEHHLDLEVSELRRAQQKAQEAQLKFIQKHNLLENELLQNSVRLENTQEKMGALQQKRDALAQQKADLGDDVAEKRQNLQTVSQSIDGQKEHMVALEEQVEEMHEQAQEVQRELNSVSQELLEFKARHKALERLQLEMEGFSPGTKRLLQESEKEGSPLYGKLEGLYTHITPQPGSELAVANVMRAYAQTLVAHTYEDFRRCIDFTEKNGLSDFSVICLEGLAPPALHRDTERATLLQKVAPTPCAAHFLNNILTAKDLESALSLAPKEAQTEIWTEEGMFVDFRRVVYCTSQSYNNVFLRSAELKSLESKLAEGEAKKNMLEGAIRTIQHKKATLQAELGELDKKIRKEEMKLVEVNFALQRAAKDLEKAHLEHRQVESELLTHATSLSKLKASIADLDSKRQEEKHKAEELQQQILENEETLQTRVNDLRLQQKSLSSVLSTHQKCADDNQALLHALSLLELKNQQSGQNELRLEEEIQSNREMQEKIGYYLESADHSLTEVEESLAIAIQKHLDLEKGVGERKKVIETTEALITKALQGIKTLESELHQLKVAIAQHAASAQAIEAELQERHHLSIAQARTGAQPSDLTAEQMERQVRALRSTLEGAGDVNMTAIEECEKQQERHHFLTQQIDDLSSSKGELNGIIAQLDGESRHLFKTTFELIRTNFQKNFRILFQGGEADLQFTDTNDLLEAGIEIIAKPPGKQMRSIQLLSGGEKCLTAMALLFAIFEVKPAPFCILDEIDAPLDDSNVERFVNVVKQFVDKCQFLIITHNKRTMAIADVLFGVSMEEKGVSKILSFEFNKPARPVNSTLTEY